MGAKKLALHPCHFAENSSFIAMDNIFFLFLSMMLFHGLLFIIFIVIFV